MQPKKKTLHKISALLLKPNMEWVEGAVKNGVLKEDGFISGKSLALIEEMQLSKEMMECRPTYASVRKFAAEKGISDNISQSTIMQALDALHHQSRSIELKPVREVDGLKYAIKQRLIPIIINEKEASLDKQRMNWKIAMRQVICPLMMAWIQVELLRDKGTDGNKIMRVIPSRLHNIAKINTLIIDAIVVILVNSDMDLMDRTLQRVSQSKHGRMMSYSSIRESGNAAQYIFDTFVAGAGEELNAIYDHISDATFTLIKPIKELLLGESNEGYAVDALEAFLKGYVAGDNMIKRNLVMFE